MIFRKPGCACHGRMSGTEPIFDFAEWLNTQPAATQAEYWKSRAENPGDPVTEADYAQWNKKPDMDWMILGIATLAALVVFKLADGRKR